MCNCNCNGPKLKVGDTIYGFCYGAFGRDSYGDKIVEAIGPDWVLVRESYGLNVYEGNPNDLLAYTKEPDEYGGYTDE